mmetsp:Transcript_2799/g.5884  ORF Transcript_2799/g.5884 Transcript_2799/m.5884 type:complete len:340 (+) Transcript_2799:16-1035(+)
MVKARGARLRLRGGGGDGGVYPLTHAELQWMTPSGMGEGGRGHNMAWTHQWKGKVEEDALRIDRAKTCAASRQALQRPVAVCDLGYLLNKEATIELIVRKAMPEHVSHIKGLKDLYDATLHDNPTFNPSDSHKQGADDDEFPYHCPIAHIPMNGRFPFVFIRSSGHVVSERALKQIGGATCPVTEVPLTEDDIVPINGTDEQREELRAKAAARKAALKEAKKAMKQVAASSTSVATGAEGAPRSEEKGSMKSPVSRPEKTAAATSGAKLAKPAAKDAQGERGPAAPGKRTREWEAVVAQKAAASSAYKSLFLSEADKKRLNEQTAANFCARGTTPRYSS